MSPYFLLSMLIGGAYGTVFHIWQGKSVKDILYYLLSGMIGFGLGQAIGDLLNWSFFFIGPLRIVEASIICWIMLFVARWLRV